MGTGFAGRTALSELLVVDDAIREAILQKVPTRALQDVAIQRGMTTLWQNGLQRIHQGETPVEEILRIVGAEPL